MKKLFTLLCFYIFLFAKSQNDIKSVNTAFYKEVVFETDQYKLYLVKCYSRNNVIKIKIRLFNKSENMIYIKAEDFEFIVNGKVLHPDKVHFLIEPGDITDRMVDVNGSDLKQEKFEINTKGIYVSSNEMEVLSMKDTEWPSGRGSDLKSGPLSCTMNYIKMDKVKSWARYSCTYTGDKLCVISPGKCVAIMPKGKENQAFTKKLAYGLMNGDTKEFPVEFKQYNGAGHLTDGITVKWKETFAEANLNALPATKVEMNFDPTQK